MEIFPANHKVLTLQSMQMFPNVEILDDFLF